MSRFVVGIDLGTTSIAVSYVDRAAGRSVRRWPVPQLVAAGEVASREILPSFCYLPRGGELPDGALTLPWGDVPYAVGELAREQGARIPGGLVSSAKSWLAHAGIDRTRGILPWGGTDGISPVEASRRYLDHVRSGWDIAFGALVDDEGTPCTLAEQDVVLTVPASFDEAARELTVRAARAAGIERLTLLEEPLAAFYDWLRQHEAAWSDELSEGEQVVVVDVGGGTTDFSLVVVEPGPLLRRTAAGEHLLLGGDNVDAALARGVEASWGGSLGPIEWAALVAQCRRAKERLLGPEPPEQVTVALGGRGQGVVAAARSQAIGRRELESLLLEGFFPLVPPDARPRRRGGLRELGLPYEADPAVTRHLVAFLEDAGAGDRPVRVLFNGGSMLPKIVRDRVRAVLGRDGGPVAELETGDPVLAVSRGAAYYGLVRLGEGVRVRGGIARAYYLEVAAGEGSDLLCVIPRDTEEGEAVELGGERFLVATNTPVRFPLWSSATRLGDRVGDTVEDRDGVSRLAPLETVLRYGRSDERRDVAVRVGAVLNEVGTLDLWCETVEGHHRYPLSFDLRADDGPSTVPPEVVVAGERRDAALAHLADRFAGDGRHLPRTPRELEELLDLEREAWGASLLRAVADQLLADPSVRERSAEHEARWLNLVGYALRPGFGRSGDEHRVGRLWRLWHRGPAWRGRSQVAAEWWTMWRRVVGGLRAGHHQRIAGQLGKVLLPKRGPLLAPGRGRRHEVAEQWRALASLERLPPARKAEIFAALVATDEPLEGHHYWALARLGARRLLFGPVDAVVPAARLEPLLDRFLLRARAGGRPGCLAIANVAQRSGIRGHDLDERWRRLAGEILSAADAPEEWQRRVAEITETTPVLSAELAGDALPLGLVRPDDPDR